MRDCTTRNYACIELSRASCVNNVGSGHGYVIVSGTCSRAISQGLSGITFS